MLNRRTAVWLALAVAAASVAAVVAQLTIHLVTPNEDLPEMVRSEPIELLDNLATLGLPLLGGLIASRRPENLLGWLFLVAGFGITFSELGGLYYALGAVVHPGSLPLPNLFAWMGNWLWAVGIGTLPFLTLLFPTGHVTSPRWRPALWLACLLYVLLVATGIAFATLIWDAPFTTEENIPSPELIEPPLLISLFGLTGLAAVGLVSLVFRYRAAGQEEREQLKWFMFGASFLVLALMADNIHGGIVVDWAVLLAQLALYAALAIAILKYRLYDIDILINRTLVYVPLTAILAGLFVASTTLARTLFTNLTDAGSDASVAIGTIAVVALLTPLKNKLQALVDARFKEQAVPAQEVRKLVGQAKTVLQVIDTDEFVRRFLDDVTTSLKAEGSAIELKNGSEPELITAGAWDGNASLSLPLCHKDREIGVLTIGPRRDKRPYDAAEAEALRESADVLAHALDLGHRQGASSADVTRPSLLAEGQ